MTCFRMRGSNKTIHSSLNKQRYNKFYQLVDKGLDTQDAIRLSAIAPYGSFVKQTLKWNFCNLPKEVEQKIKNRNKRVRETIEESIVWAKRKGLC